jgi:hypothetical protein
MKKLCFAIFFLGTGFFNCPAQPISITITNSHALVAGYATLPSTQPPLPYAVLFVEGSFNLMFSSYCPSPGVCGTVPPDWYASNPGRGIILTLHHTNELTVTVTNPSPQILPLPIPAGYSLVCCQSNVPATFDMILGRPPDEGTKLFRFTNAMSATVPNPPSFNGDSNYMMYTFSGGSWTPEQPVADAGEAVWVYQPPVISNLQLVGTNVSFDALTAWGAITTVQYASSLIGPWQELTNFGYAGGLMSVLDPADVTVTGQRFYRLNVLASP